MKITRSSYEKALAKHYGTVTVCRYEGTDPVYAQPYVPSVERVLRELGIEIVPDPGPDLPPKPWRLHTGPEPLVVRVLDAQDKVVIGAKLGDTVSMASQVRWLMALVAAYNATGEGTQLAVSSLGDGRWLCCDAKHRLAGHSAASKALAIGFFVADHASDLGLEIVES